MLRLQKSYCICWVSQLSAVPPKASDNRMAISGDMPRKQVTP